MTRWMLLFAIITYLFTELYYYYSTINLAKWEPSLLSILYTIDANVIQWKDIILHLNHHA